MAKNKAMEFLCGRMEENMKETGKMIKLREKELIIKMIEALMKVGL